MTTNTEIKTLEDISDILTQMTYIGPAEPARLASRAMVKIADLRAALEASVERQSYDALAAEHDDYKRRLEAANTRIEADFHARQLIDFIYDRIGFSDRDVLIPEVQRHLIASANKSYAAGVRDTKDIAAVQPDSGRDAALVQAAAACMRATPDRAAVRAIGEAAHYVACRDAVLALRAVQQGEQAPAAKEPTA